MCLRFVLSPAYAGSCDGGDHVHNLEEMASKYLKRLDAGGCEIITKEQFEALPVAIMLQSFDTVVPNENGVVTKRALIQTFVKTFLVTKNEA